MDGNEEQKYSTEEYDVILEDGSIAPMAPQEVTCEECGKPFMKSLTDWERNLWGKLKENPNSMIAQAILKLVCQPCIDSAEERHKEKIRQEREDRWRDSWKSICPPLYRNTDISRLPANGLSAIMAWDYNKDGIGLGIIGPPGKCKTRLIYQLGQRIHNDHHEVDAISATVFASVCSGMFGGDDKHRSTCMERLQEITYADFLIFDDIGKQKFTERVEMEFYALLEARTSNLLPTFWTANATSKELAAMMSKDRSEAIIRRLSEFSTIVTV